MSKRSGAYRGILLAGGTGSRLYPTTVTSSKQLMAVFDKPMVYYPLTTLMLAGVREILVISTPHDLPRYRTLLGDGSRWGIRLEYAEQAHAGGIAQAVLIGEEFIGDRPVILMLGDNVLFGRYDFLRGALTDAGDDATIFAYEVDDPAAYGVVEFDENGRVLSLEEKPEKPRSRWAVPGLYIYPPGVASEAHQQEPSERGELEITDLNLRYLAQGRLRALRMGRGTAWFDTGTAEDLLDASGFVHAIQHRQGLIIGCPEEVAFRGGFIDREALDGAIAAMPVCTYRTYLERVAREPG